MKPLTNVLLTPRQQPDAEMRSHPAREEKSVRDEGVSGLCSSLRDRSQRPAPGLRLTADRLIDARRLGGLSTERIAGTIGSACWCRMGAPREGARQRIRSVAE